MDGKGMIVSILAVALLFAINERYLGLF